MPDPVSLLRVTRLEPGIDCLLIKVQVLEAESSVASGRMAGSLADLLAGWVAKLRLGKDELS